MDEGSAIAPIPLHNATLNIFEDKHKSIRIVVGLTCALSIIGSLLIILSYLVQKNRTRAREILAHISLMDLGVSLSNLIGLLVYFDKFYAGGATPPVHVNYFCKIQAFFAMYCTLGSIFWTTALAAYLYIVILHHKNPKYSIYFLRFCYVLCYGLAISISVWLLIAHKLGYAPYDSSGWCSLIVKNPVTKEVDLFVLIFAYDLWIYLAIILIVVFYVSIKSFLSNQLKISKESYNVSAAKFWSTMNFVDYKFIMIPVTFILLRMWTCILGVLTEYARVDEHRTGISTFLLILLYLGGIGDSGQGFVNAILFIAFSKAARKSLMRILCVCCKRHKNMRFLEESTTSEEEEADSSPSTLKRPIQEGAASSLLYGSTDDDIFQSAPTENSVNIDDIH